LPVEDHDHDYTKQAAAWQQESGEIVESAKENAPAWLASSVLHVTIMLVLALWVWSDPAPPSYELELMSELPGEQTIDDSVALDIPDASDEEQALALSTLDEVIDPLSAPLELDNPLDAETLAPDITAPNIGNTFDGRQPGSKASVLAGYGASDGSENAVAFGLAWLAKQQRPDGSWSLIGPYPDGSQYNENTVAATAMAMLAFQGAGHTHKGQGSYRSNLRKGVYYLLENQKGNGDFYTAEVAARFGNDAHLYSHGQATIAICELYAMTGDEELKEPAQRAINFCVEAQDPDFGGWRYNPGRARDSDVSVTGWILMALQSGRIAGLEVPSETLNRASLFLDMAAVKQNSDRRQFPLGSRYSYMPGGGPNPPMTAEGLLCRQYLGWDREDERMVAGIEYLSDERNVPNWQRRNVYAWYYMTQTLHNYGGEKWRAWNDVMRDLLVDHQAKTGNEKGSWHPTKPDADEFAGEGGRLYVTCLSLYILEVYYRHLPIYGSAAH
jgi:hypothetical protein